MGPLRSPRGLAATIETPSARATGYDVDVDDGLSIIVYRYDSSLADARVRLIHSVMGLMWSRVDTVRRKGGDNAFRWWRSRQWDVVVGGNVDQLVERVFDRTRAE